MSPKRGFDPFISKNKTQGRKIFFSIKSPTKKKSSLASQDLEITEWLRTAKKSNPNVLNDILEIVVISTGKEPNSYIQFYFDCELKKLFYSVWALLNLWVDWSVLRVCRERAITRISWRNSCRGMTKSLLPEQEEYEPDLETFYETFY